MSFARSDSLEDMLTPKYLMFPAWSGVDDVLWRSWLMGRTVDLAQLMEYSEIDVNLLISDIVSGSEVCEF